MNLTFNVKVGVHRREVVQAILDKAGMASFKWDGDTLKVNSLADFSKKDRREINKLIRQRQRKPRIN